MNWEKVEEHLRLDADRLKRDAVSAFPNDMTTQREMISRAFLLSNLANALRAGMQ